MSDKNSLANKKRWSKISRKERSEKMRQLALIKAKKMTKEEKRKHAQKMVKARFKNK